MDWKVPCGMKFALNAAQPTKRIFCARQSQMAEGMATLGSYLKRKSGFIVVLKLLRL
jgi:hypothetical protein